MRAHPPGWALRLLAISKTRCPGPPFQRRPHFKLLSGLLRCDAMPDPVLLKIQRAQKHIDELMAAILFQELAPLCDRV